MPERVGPEPSVYVKLTPEQDARNAALAHEVLTRPLRDRTKQLAKDREAYCRKLLEHRLPRLLRWTFDHPRALRILLRLVPRWRPTLTYVRLEADPYEPVPKTEQATRISADAWLVEMRAKGWTPEANGLVFPTPMPTDYRLRCTDRERWCH